MADVANWDVASIDTAGNITTDGGVEAAGGFTGDLTGDVTGNVTGTVNDIVFDSRIYNGNIDEIGNYSFVLLDSDTEQIDGSDLVARADGQPLTIYCLGYTNTITLTGLVNLAQSTLTFSAEGQYVSMIYSVSVGAWTVIANNGVVIS